MTARCTRLASLLAVGAVVAAAVPAWAQIIPTDRFGRSVSDVQGYNLAGGGDFVEVNWPVYARFRTYEDNNTTSLATIEAGRAPAQDVEVRNRANRAFGAEARLSLAAVPWLFGTAEYRRARYDEFRVQGANGQTSGFRDIPDDGAAYVGVGGLGAGVAIPRTPFYARAEYSFIYTDGLGLGNDRRFDGVAAYGGLTQPITSWLGVRAEAGYQEYHDFGDGFAWRAGANLNLTPQIALTGTYRAFQLHKNDGVNARLDDATVGLRFQFAR